MDARSDTATAPVEAVREPVGATAASTRRPRWWWDLGAAVAYIAAAVGVTAGLWADARGNVLAALGGADNVLFEWFLAHAAHAVTALENPLYSHAMNAPDGVNMMANTSVLGLGIPMTPVTVLFGPLVSFKVLLVVAMAGTAWSWYFVLSRHLVASRAAAVLGGAFCGFAPGMVAQSNGSHLQIATQFLVPLIVWRVLRLGRPGRAVRNGVVLGLLITYQFFIGEEILLLTALACAVVLATYAAMRPAEVRAAARTFLTAAGVAVGVAAVLLAYPMWFQFAGPQHYDGLPFNPERYFSDLASYPSYARQSWFGSPDTAKGLAGNLTEENTFYGWALVVLVPLAAAWLWRTRLAARVVGIAIAVFFLMSLGSQVMIHGKDSGLNGPWALLKRIPPFDLTMATRLSLVLIPLAGVLLALLGDRLWGAEPAVAAQAGEGAPEAPPRRRPMDLALRVAGTLAVVVALAPIAPTDLPTRAAPPLPTFFTAGTWRDYLPAGTTLVPAPVPYGGAMDGAHWLSNTDLPFRVPGGYFIIPTADGKSALFTSEDRPLSTLLTNVGHTGDVPPITDADRRDAVADLRYWNAGLIVLAPGRPKAAALRQVLTDLFGPPQQVQDVLLWPTAGITG